MIKVFRILLGVLLFALLLFYSLAFATRNAQSTTLDFLTGFEFSLPVSVWLMIFFVVGALAGSLVAGSISALRGAKIRRLNKELAELKDKMARLK